MENACSFARNVMYDYLRKKGGVPNIKCISNMAKMVKNNVLLPNTNTLTEIKKATGRSHTMKTMTSRETTILRMGGNTSLMKASKKQRSPRTIVAMEMLLGR